MKPFSSLFQRIPLLHAVMTPITPHGERAHLLATTLGLAPSELSQIQLGAHYHYRPRTIPKREGGERRLLIPSPALKTLQRRFLDGYLATLPLPLCATAFRRGASPVKNALAHARQRILATVDLRDFFESTRGSRVRACLIHHGWGGEDLRILMRLCVFRDSLPQGAPTSPCLSNLVNVPLDERLTQLTQSTGGVYTRYGDDLTFSWDTEHVPGGFRDTVEDVLGKFGYSIQPKKGWRITPIQDRPCVTGLILSGNGRVSLPWRLRWRMVSLTIRTWLMADLGLLARLRSYRAYRNMVRRTRR